VRRSEVRPLAEIGLAEDHGAGVAQPRDEKRVDRRDRSLERERPRGRLHAVVRRNVVLDQDGDAVERAARALRLSLEVEGVGGGQRVGIDLNDTVQAGPAAVDCVDACEVLLRD
jgi:hypothetical protein